MTNYFRKALHGYIIPAYYVYVLSAVLSFCFALSFTYIMLLFAEQQDMISGKEEVETYQDDATGYKIYKDGQYVGVLIGSIHNLMNLHEMNQFDKLFSHYLQDDAYSLTEIPINSFHVTQGAVESALNTASINNGAPNFGFSTADVDSMMVSVRTYMLGGTRYVMPLNHEFIRQHPKLTRIAMSLMYKVKPVLDIFYQTAAYQQKVGVQDIEMLQKVHKNYRLGIHPPMTVNTERALELRARDKFYADQFQQMVKLYPDKKWVILLGASHLFGHDSMRMLLEEQGYVLKGFNAYQAAMEC